MITQLKTKLLKNRLHKMSENLLIEAYQLLSTDPNASAERRAEAEAILKKLETMG